MVGKTINVMLPPMISEFLLALLYPTIPPLGVSGNMALAMLSQVGSHTSNWVRQQEDEKIWRIAGTKERHRAASSGGVLWWAQLEVA